MALMVLVEMKQTVVKPHCGSDVGVRLTQLLSQALSQSRHSVLGRAVEMYVGIRSDTMSRHAATEERRQHQHLATCINDN